jgi:hypothetical protein
MSSARMSVLMPATSWIDTRECILYLRPYHRRPQFRRTLKSKFFAVRRSTAASLRRSLRDRRSGRTRSHGATSPRQVRRKHAGAVSRERRSAPFPDKQGICRDMKPFRRRRATKVGQNSFCRRHFLVMLPKSPNREFFSHIRAGFPRNREGNIDITHEKTFQRVS